MLFLTRTNFSTYAKTLWMYITYATYAKTLWTHATHAIFLTCAKICRTTPTMPKFDPRHPWTNTHLRYPRYLANS